jgi:hypothetical protein
MDDGTDPSASGAPAWDNGCLRRRLTERVASAVMDSTARTELDSNSFEFATPETGEVSWNYR